MNEPHYDYININNLDGIEGLLNLILEELKKLNKDK